MGTIHFAFPVEWLVEGKKDFDIPAFALFATGGGHTPRDKI
jgi:hypothetical protein